MGGDSKQTSIFETIVTPQKVKYPKELLDPTVESNPAEVLKFFFELRDRKSVAIVDELFRIYEFQDIAHGIYKKYRILPAGWQITLKKLKKEGDEKLKWLNLGQIQWLTEMTQNFPPIRKKLAPYKDDNLLEQIVNEFVANEKEYFKKIDSIMTHYIAEIDAIATNKLGPNAQEALGLTSEQVNTIFGSLTEVHKAVETLLVMLETITLVPGELTTTEGRHGQLARLLSDAGPSLVKAYAPYNSTYMEAKELRQSQKKRLLRNQSGVTQGLRHLNFDEIWNEIAQSKPLLKSLAIDSILILPIRRLPNYKVYMGRLLKVTKKVNAESPAIPLLEKAFDDIQKCTEEINAATGGDINID